MAVNFGYYPRSDYPAAVDFAEIAETDRAGSRAVEIVRDPADHPRNAPRYDPFRPTGVTGREFVARRFAER